MNIKFLRIETLIWMDSLMSGEIVKYLDRWLNIWVDSSIFGEKI